MTVFQEYWPILRSLGFRLHWKQTNEGKGIRQYYRNEPDGRRTVHVQLWEDHTHRVCHEVDNGSSIYDQNGNAIVVPTDFTDPLTMVLAINHEATRMDSERWIDGWQTKGRNAK